MNVASLDLCEQLFELSGWKSELTWAKTKKENIILVNSYDNNLGHQFYRYSYAYDLGYLLRKLPTKINGDVTHWLVITPINDRGAWAADYEYDTYDDVDCLYNIVADTPEDAAALLAIELFEQKILTKDKE